MHRYCPFFLSFFSSFSLSSLLWFWLRSVCWIDSSSCLLFLLPDWCDPWVWTGASLPASSLQVYHYFFHFSHDVVHFLAHTVSSPFVFFSSARSLMCSGHALCCVIVGCMLTFSHTRSLSCCWCDSWVTIGASLPVSSLNTSFMFSIFNYNTHFHCTDHVTTQ